MSTRKSLWWICSSKKDLKQMPTDVQDVFGYALLSEEVGFGYQKEPRKPISI